VKIAIFIAPCCQLFGAPCRLSILAWNSNLPLFHYSGLQTGGRRVAADDSLMTPNPRKKDRINSAEYRVWFLGCIISWLLLGLEWQVCDASRKAFVKFKA
jgi:hypothetical protein